MRQVRKSKDRKIAGVCSGIASCVGLEPWLVRLAYFLVTFFSAVVPGTVIYIALAFILPPAEDIELATPHQEDKNTQQRAGSSLVG